MRRSGKITSNNLSLSAQVLLWFLFAFMFSMEASCRTQDFQGYPSIAPDYSKMRQQMVVSQLSSRDIWDSRVLEAMGKVPRHRFVPDHLRTQAYEDHPLPIGQGQTISQPYIVALMTQLVNPSEGDRALEIGTGSGYQSALLAELVDRVYTIEIVPELSRQSEDKLHRLGYNNVHVRLGDGYQGWPEQGPFDIILITAAATRIPEPLQKQLAEGGRLVIPVGEPSQVQKLVLLTKNRGKIRQQEVVAVRFVPMTGQIQN